MISTSNLQFVDSSLLLDDVDTLRARAENDGYLFFRQLIPAEDVLRVRSDALQVIERYGWRKSGQDEFGGLLDIEALNQVPGDQMRLDVGVSNDAYDDVQKLESIHRLPHHPQLIALYEAFFGCSVLVHPRHIVRLVTPHPVMTPTPQHQDFPLVQGTSNTWTCWFPLGDCPRSLGGLTVLRASHQLGCLPVQPSKGAGDVSAQTCPWEQEWVEGEFCAGDVLTFPSLTVHKALPCQHKDQIRMSLDVRYQPADEPVEIKSLLPHCGLTWEEIYAEWQQHDLQYYWNDLPLTISEWNASLMRPSRRIC